MNSNTKSQDPEIDPNEEHFTLDQNIVELIEKNNIVDQMYPHLLHPYKNEHIECFEKINDIELPQAFKFYLTHISREIRINDMYIFPIFKKQPKFFHQYDYKVPPKIIKQELNKSTYYLANEFFNIYVPMEYFNNPNISTNTNDIYVKQRIFEREYVRYNFKDEDQEIDNNSVKTIEFKLNGKRYKTKALELITYKDINGKTSTDYLIVTKNDHYGYVVTKNQNFIKTKKTFYNYILRIW